MDSSSPILSPGKGRVLLRDSLVFLTLCCATVVLFGITLFLFRSFERHRATLGREWSARGREALRRGQPSEAVIALRVALSYEPNERGDQFTLAQALAASGHSDEAMNYFLTLWEQRPGEGIINQQLARLARARNDAPEAIRYYRAAIFGSWEGDGALRRRETRLELADYFKQRGNDAAARQELLIAAGNAPPEEFLEVSLGDRLESIGDPSDALQLYTKALQQDPHRRSALIKAGRAAYQLSDYPSAARLLETALHEPPTSAAPASEDADLQAMVATARRIPELRLSRDLPAQERADHLLTAGGIARRRLQTCSARFTLKPDTAIQPGTMQNAALTALQARWKAAVPAMTRKNLDRDASAEDAATQLIADTEAQTAMACGTPSGDDALLLKLAAQAAQAAPAEPALTAPAKGASQ